MGRSFLSLFSCLAAFLVLVPSARSEVFPVGNVTDFQTALTTAANNGENDTINVAAGTYNVGTTLFFGSGEAFSLTIAGAGAATTILDGGNAVQVMRLIHGGDMTVSGLTIRNGDGTASGNPGAGLEISANGIGTTTAVSDCIFSGNVNSPIGGGLRVDDETVTITNSTFTGNAAAPGQGPGGGASAFGNTSLSISNSTFMNNGNDGMPAGGGLEISGGNAVTISNSTFSGNTVGPMGQGAGLVVFAGALTITGSTFDNNSADAVCGGAPGGSGAGAYIQASDLLRILESTFSNNGVPCGPGPGGGALHAVQNGNAEVRVVNNFFFNNVSGSGVASSSGALSFDSRFNAVNVTNNTFSGNDSGDATADILVFVTNDQASANIYNNIFWGGPGDDLLEVRDANATPVRIFNNDIDIATVTLTNGNDFLFGGNHNIDPLFVNMAGGDLHLTETSPVIGMGLNTAPAIPAFDFDGDTRILEGTVDMGADEFTLPPTNPATFNAGTGILDIPEVQLVSTNVMAGAGTKAYQVQLKRLGEPGYVFELAGAKKMTATAVPSATFNTKTGVLDIPVVRIQGLAKTYNVLMQQRAGEFVFDLTKAKKN